LFNKLRFENKINIKMWGCFGILEIFMGERVNKIRYDGTINKEIRSRVVSTYVFEEKGRKGKRREETKRAAIFCILKVRVSLAYNSIKPVIHMIISNKCRDSFGGFGN